MPYRENRLPPPLSQRIDARREIEAVWNALGGPPADDVRFEFRLDRWFASECDGTVWRASEALDGSTSFVVTRNAAISG